MVEIQLHAEDMNLNIKFIIVLKLSELVWNVFAVLNNKLLFSKDQ